MKNALLEAHDLIYGNREDQYGPPGPMYEAVAAFWQEYLARKHNLTCAMQPEDVTQMMILLKVVRLMHNPQHRDSLVDIAGYAGLQDRIQSQMSLPLGVVA